MRAVHDVIFYEEGHTYMRKDKKLKSITTRIKDFSTPFRKDYWLTYKALQRKGKEVKSDAVNTVPKDHILIDNKLKHYSKVTGVKRLKAVIEKEWKETSKKGTTRGTNLHNYLENRVQNKVINRGKGKLYDQADQFVNDFTFLKPVALEVIVANEKYAGQIDGIFKNMRTKEYWLVDYKTDKEIKRSNFFQSMQGELRHLDDCNYIKYCLQTSAYVKLIEKNTGIKISKVIIVWFNENNESYEIIEPEFLDYETNILLS
jgi:hypothetical protein